MQRKYNFTKVKKKEHIKYARNIINIKKYKNLDIILIITTFAARRKKRRKGTRVPLFYNRI